MIIKFIRVCFILLVLTTITLQSKAEVQDDMNVSWDDYKVLVERNMFSRTRGVKVERSVRQTRKEPESAPGPENYIILRGIVRQDNRYQAFLEDTRTAEIVKAQAGGTVAGGKLKNITIDHIEFDLKGKIARVEIGKNLKGIDPSSSTGYSNDSSLSVGFSETKSGETPGTVNKELTGDSSDVLKRLMERRKKELGE